MLHRSASVLSEPITLQRLEGGVLFVLSVLIYWKLAGSWLWYVPLILAPDLFMLGYLAGPRLGAAVYNLGHTWLLPGVLAAMGLIGGASFALDVALIWIGHIGADRMLGYGLKLPTAFQDTHLGRIGRNR
jgi:Domain of unknown function (DUF4260)